MSVNRISQREKQRLVARALRERARRAERNRAAAEERAAKGRCRIKAWVPVQHAAGIRALAVQIDTRLSHGLLPRLRLAAASALPEEPAIASGSANTSGELLATLPSEGRGLGARARKNLQNKRARARKKVAGQKRIMIEVTAAYRDQIKSILRQAIRHLSAGGEIDLDPSGHEVATKPDWMAHGRPHFASQEAPQAETCTNDKIKSEAAERREESTVSSEYDRGGPTSLKGITSDMIEEEGSAALFYEIKALGRILQ
ncbi:MAG: hypothetical protein KGI94_09300 [Paracoccaceae bacterium]|nr:hypothetical protein [Paracoccaceae bacterium]